MQIVQLNLFECKRCRICGEQKPFTDFHKRKDSPDGYRNDCITCHYMRCKVYANENREKVREIGRRWAAKKYQTDPEYREYSKDNYKEWYKNNRDYALTKAKEYRDKPGFKDRRREYDKGRVEHHRFMRRKWRKENRERYLLNKHRRRAAERSANGSYTVEQWRELLALCGDKCLSCGKTERITVDHIVPVSQGGSNQIDNVQPLCFWCNSGKRDKTIDYRSQEVKTWATNQSAS